MYALKCKLIAQHQQSAIAKTIYVYYQKTMTKKISNDLSPAIYLTAQMLHYMLMEEFGLLT